MVAGLYPANRFHHHCNTGTLPQPETGHLLVQALTMRITVHCQVAVRVMTMTRRTDSAADDLQAPDCLSTVQATPHHQRSTLRLRDIILCQCLPSCSLPQLSQGSVGHCVASELCQA
jgi:hypothetical protein